MAAPFKVSIRCMGQSVVLEASPILTEDRTASWDNYNLVHLPTTIWAYKNTSSRHFGLQAKLVSRNAREAQKNAEYLNLVRSWVLPDFGGSGATPPIVTLTAYNNSNINNLNCIITNYGWTFDDQTDYIFSDSEPMPVIGGLSIDLQEIYSPEEISAIDPWKIKDIGGNVVGATPNIMSFGDAFAGLASGNFTSLMNSLNNSVDSLATQSINSIARNAISDAVRSSPAISETVSAINAVTSNRNLTSLAPGETGGIPNVTSVTHAAGDAFGRVVRSIGGPIFG